MFTLNIPAPKNTSAVIYNKRFLLLLTFNFCAVTLLSTPTLS